MREIAGAIVVLAGSILFATGMVADALPHGSGRAGYWFGMAIGLIGFGILFDVGGALRRFWDSIPTDDKRPGSGERASSSASANSRER